MQTNALIRYQLSMHLIKVISRHALCLLFSLLLFNSIAYSYSKKLELACEHALEGSPNAAKYMSEYFYNKGQECSGDFFLILFNLLGPKIKLEPLSTECKMSSDVYSMAMKCANNLSQCLIQNRQSVVRSKRQFFSEYYYPVPFGWPTYSHALDIQLKQNKSPCLID